MELGQSKAKDVSDFTTGTNSGRVAMLLSVLVNKQHQDMNIFNVVPGSSLSVQTVLDCIHNARNKIWFSSDCHVVMPYSALPSRN
jgi:hypothetical protein